METHMCSARTCEKSFENIVICRLYKKNPAEQQKKSAHSKEYVFVFFIRHMWKYTVMKFCTYVMYTCMSVYIYFFTL